MMMMMMMMLEMVMVMVNDDYNDDDGGDDGDAVDGGRVVGVLLATASDFNKYKTFQTCIYMSCCIYIYIYMYIYIKKMYTWVGS